MNTRGQMERGMMVTVANCQNLAGRPSCQIATGIVQVREDELHEDHGQMNLDLCLDRL